MTKKSSDDNEGLHIPKVAFLTLGETPRIDMVPDVLEHLDSTVEPIEYGLMDRVGPSAIVQPGFEDKEDCLITRLKNGNNVMLSRRWADHRLSEIADDALSEGAEYVVVLSTGGVESRLNPLCITVHGQKEINRTISSLVAAGLEVGVIFALEEQAIDVRRQGWLRAGMCAAAYPENDEALIRAASVLASCDLIVLHSVRCSERDAQLVKSVTGKPVILSRQVIISTLNSAIEKRLSKCNANSESTKLLYKLRLLSKRERDVIPYVAEGLSSKEIARILGISHRTVEIHRARAKEKLGIVSWVPLFRVINLINGAD